PEVIEEDKESVVSYETDNSFHPDWRQDFNAKKFKIWTYAEKIPEKLMGEKIEFVKKAIRAKTELTLVRVENNRKDKMISVLFDNKENIQAALEECGNGQSLSLITKELLNQWSIIIGEDLFRITPTDCNYDNLMSRGKFAARIINLPFGITAKEIIPNIKTIGALTCYIPRSCNYRHRNETIISFVSEEVLETTFDKEWKA
ncbi:9543_t:CDS:2, partial [Diversispora eburnea]